MSIRRAKPEDKEQITKIYQKAFDTDAEAILVSSLCDSGIPTVSLVYEDGKKITGHILFTPVELVGDDSDVKIAGLGPMGVLPRDQYHGIGSSLVKAGLEECKSDGYDAAVVLGYTAFYPRFGFIPSVKFGIATTFNVPEDVFMVQELKPGVLQGRQGTIKFHQAFDEFKR